MTARRLGIARSALLSTLLLAVLPFASATGAPSPGTRTLPRLTMRTVSGEKIALEDLLRRGPVLLDFWATWCKPCHAAMPELEALHRKYRGRGFTIIGISIDGPRNFAKVRPFAVRLGITYPVVLDEDGELQRAYQVRAVPTTLLLDRSGSVHRVQQGYRPGETRDLERAIVALLPDTTVTDTSAAHAPGR